MIDVIKIPDNYLPDKLLYQWDFFVLFYFYQTPGEIASSVFKMSVVLHIVWWYSKIDCVSLNILNTVELYILNGWITWYVNDISIKLLNIESNMDMDAT